MERDFYVRDMTYFFERTEYEGEGGMLAFSFHPAIQHLGSSLGVSLSTEGGERKGKDYAPSVLPSFHRI